MAIQGTNNNPGDVFSTGPRRALPTSEPEKLVAAPVARDSAAVKGSVRERLEQERAAVKQAIVKLVGTSRAALDWSKFDYTPRQGGGVATVADARGRELAFSVRQGEDGLPVVSLLQPARQASSLKGARQVEVTTRAAELGPLAARAAKIQQAEKQAESGNVVARGFNSFVDVFTHNQRQMRQAMANAVRAYSTDLPRDLATYHELQAAAGSDPAKQAAAKAFLDGATAKAKLAGDRFDAAQAKFSSTNKFWSGMAADVGASLAVLGGAALCITGFGAPLGAGMIAATFGAGGALTVGAHALLDNHYDARHEALGNFLVGGLSTAGMAWAGGGGMTVGRMAMAQGAIGGATSTTGAMIQEGQDGFKAGWQGRVALGGLVGAGAGLAAGALMPGIAGKLHLPTADNALVAKAVQAGVSGAVGGVTGAASATVTEGMGGFKQGWQGRVGQQALGGTLAGTAFGFAPALHARAASPVATGAEARYSCMPDSVRDVFKAKLTELGFPQESGSADQMLSCLTDDKVFGALLRQTVNNDRYAFKVRNTLAHYGPEALKADMTTPEGQMARLKLLALSFSPETRELLMERIDQRLTTQTVALKRHFQLHPEDAVVDVLAIGTGPNAVALASEANKAGTHSVLLVGEGFSHFQREGDAFQTNSPNGVHRGHAAPKAGELASPVYGSPVQASDLGSTMYNNAGHVGDAAGMGLLYASEGPATQVMTHTRVKDVTPILDASGQRQWYEVEMTDGTKVRAKKLVVGAGLGDEPNLPTDPVTRKTDAGTAAFATGELAKTRQAIASNRASEIAKLKVLTAEQYLTLANQTDDPGILYRGKDTMIVGPGDGGIVTGGVILGDAPASVYGIATAQMGGAGKVTMVGQPDLWSRYGRMDGPVKKGLMDIVKDTYVTGLKPVPGSDKVEVTLQPMKTVERPNPRASEPGQPATLSSRVAAGPPITQLTDRVVLATGSKSGEGALLSHVAPEGYNPETMSLKDKNSPFIEPVVGADPEDAAARLELAYRVKGQDIYTIGVSAPLGQRQGHSWLQDHGARTQGFARQLVSDPAAVGLKAKLPEETHEGPVERLQPSTRLGRSTSPTGPVTIERDLEYNPRVKHGDTTFRIKVLLDELFTKQQVGFEPNQKLEFTVREHGGKLELDAPGLDAQGAKRLGALLGLDRDLSHYLHDVAQMNELTFSLGFGPDGLLRSNRIHIGT